MTQRVVYTLVWLLLAGVIVYLADSAINPNKIAVLGEDRTVTLARGLDGHYRAEALHGGADGFGIENLAGGVDHRDLATGANAGVNAHRIARSGRGGQQQVFEIAGEHADGLDFRAFAQLDHQING